MDGFTGNPPFMGQSRISGDLGESFRDWIFMIHEGALGKSDLCAHFFRRVGALLGARGAAGLIATNTIAQGDTRKSGLKELVKNGFVIFDAKRSTPWPGQASVTVSIVHICIGLPDVGDFTLNGKPCSVINSLLRPKIERADPLPLLSNASSAFLGFKLYGQGFILTPDERELFVSRSPKNDNFIFPYLGGAEVNSSPVHAYDRYAIDFGELSLSDLEGYPELVERVREKVYPERLRVKRESLRKRWWQHGEKQPALRESLADVGRCLVTACGATKHLVFSFQPTDRLFSHALYVFPLETFTSFAILQSRIHTAWAWLLSSTMKSDLRYSGSDCFSNFPFPHADTGKVIAEVEKLGEELYKHRAKYMIDTDQGLTDTYNLLKNAECQSQKIIELRILHENLDRCVLDAYGWLDISVPSYCPVGRAEEDDFQEFEDEIIDRLYILNAERVAEEERQGLTRAATQKKPPKKKVQKITLEKNPTLDLF
jgi:hypothetical protein